MISNEVVTALFENSKGAITASGTTAAAGPIIILSQYAGTALSVLGCVASLVGITITVLLYLKQKKKLDIEIRLLEK